MRGIHLLPSMFFIVFFTLADSIRTAFEATYIDPGDLVATFANKIVDTCMSKCKVCTAISNCNIIDDTWTQRKDEFYGPHFSICQSSGYGKSRLIREVLAPSLLFMYHIVTISLGL